MVSRNLPAPSPYLRPRGLAGLRPGFRRFRQQRFWERQRPAISRRWLTLRTIVAAPPRNNRAPDNRPAPVARMPFASVSPMMLLIFAGLAIAILKIRNRGAAHHNGLAQNFLQHALEC